MGQLKLQAQQIYYLKVTEFRAKGKVITKGDGYRYELWYVKVENKEGDSVLCEFACREGECKSDTFVPGVWQHIRCGILSPMGTPEIEPSDPPGANGQPAGKGKSNDETLNAAANDYLLKVQGCAGTFSIGYAKDILCAEIGRQEFGYRVTDEDVQKMLRFANMINNEMAERARF